MASPKKSLGQNFLVDNNICRKIVASLGIDLGDTVLEIGPGRGALTGLMLDSMASVFALEKDMDLCRLIRRSLPGISLACLDILTFDWTRLAGLSRLRIAGNLPYNIASRALWDMACQTSNFEKAVFMVQKEVAQRIVAGPGTKTYGALSVWIQSFVSARILFKVSPMVFRPRPKVDSAVLEFMPLADEKKIFSRQELAETIKIMFRHRRKQIGSILTTYWNDKAKSMLERMGIDPRSRPEDLAPGDFQGLSGLLFSKDQQILS